MMKRMAQHPTPAQRILGSLRLVPLKSMAALAAVLSPALALAQQQPEHVSLDGRLEGFGSNVTLDGGSTAIYWLLFIALALLAVGVLFKNGKRTHLD